MKYKLTDETIEHNGKTLYRIQALKDFGNVKTGDLGGYVESMTNLSQNGNCWVADNARVFEDARVLGMAVICENARISGNARVSGNAWVFGNTQIKDGFVG